jgi:hypothetical protein
MAMNKFNIRKLYVFVGFGFLASVLAGCQMPSGQGDFHQLTGGTFENTGAVIEEPGVFRIVGGQPYTTPFAIDCTKLSADASGWQDALKAGAHKVAITLPGQPRQYGGVLAFCTIHKSATGPSSRSYQLVIPAAKIPEASDGLISSVAEQVSVQRRGLIDLAAVLMAPPGQGVPEAPVITDDFAWMLWFTDRPSAMGISFVVDAPQPPPHAAAVPAGPKLAKGATYTLTRALTLRAGPGANAAVVTQLGVGDTVVAVGEEKAGYWSVTTVGGQAGWVSARSLKAN